MVMDALKLVLYNQDGNVKMTKIINLSVIKYDDLNPILF